MSFLSPWVLAGLAAVAIPIVIHLLNKFRVKTTDWAAMKLLMDSVRREEKRVKMDDLLLLILRCAMIAIAVLAFARPVLKGIGSNDDSGGPVAAVILLDNSASMGRMEGATQRFDLAKQEIRTWLDGLHSRSEVAMILASQVPVSLIAEPVNDPSLLKKALDEADLSDKGSDLQQALGQAIDALRQVDDRPKEIRLYTDAQRSALRDPETLKRLAREHPEIAIRPFVIGSAEDGNLGIVSLEASGGIPSTATPVRFHAKVLNAGNAEVKDLALAFTVDGKTPAGSVTFAKIAAGETAEADIEIEISEAGPHSITAELPTDSLAADNRRSVAVDVARRRDVVLASDDGQAPSALYLAKALAPVSADKAGQYFLAPLPATTADLPQMLNAGDGDLPFAVFLCEASVISPELAEALDGYVNKGGNLVIMPGAQSEVERWQASPTLAVLLPAKLSAAAELDPDAPGKSWQGKDFVHPVSRFWNDPANGKLASVTFSKRFPLVAGGAGSEVILAFSDGTPSVIEARHGEGSVVLFSFPLSPEWSNLPLHPSCVPFFQRFMGYLDRQSQGSLNLQPGEMFRMACAPEAAGKSFTVKMPGEDEARSAGEVSSASDGSLLRYEDTWRAGAYEVAIDGEHVATFAVQLDPEESQLDPISAEDLKQWTTAPRETSFTSNRMVVLKEYLPTLLWILVVAAILESVMACIISRARLA